MKKLKLKTKGKKKTKFNLGQTALTWLLILGIGFVSLCLVFALYIIIASPDFDTNKLYHKDATVIFDKDKNEIARIGEQNRKIIYYDDLPEVLIDALVATEDSRFYQHNGVDMLRFIKASIGQITGNSSAGGASTISMQVIKNTYTSREASGIKGIIRKFTDIYMAVFKLEAKYTKDEIMEFYFNSQWLGYDGNLNYAGIYGVEQASQYYFAKSAKDLTLPEASLLVGMFQNPNLYNPFRNPEGCKNRQGVVLGLMVKHGYITEEEKKNAQEISIPSLLAKKEVVTDNSNQAFIDYVLQDVSENTDFDPYKDALEIYTSFDPKVQEVLTAVEKGEAFEFPNDVVQFGVAVTDVKNGSIVALSGGRGYKAKGLNRATDITRQPGSTAKPIIDYAMYIEHISQSTYSMFLDEPTTYSNGTKISDYDNRYKGLITMRYALEDSRNIPALLAFKEVANQDLSILEDFAHSIGINYGEALYESASIGGFNGMSPLDMAAAYASFGREGYYIEPYSFTKVINSETGDEYKNSYTKNKVMEETTAYMINNILVNVYGGRGVSGTQIGGKTGTTNLDAETKKKHGLPGGASNDFWLVSYSSDYSIALWYGYDALGKKDEEGNPYYLTSGAGGTARRQIMNYLATRIYKKNSKFSVPKNLTRAKVELETFPAQLCSEFTPSNLCVSEYFVSGTEPTDVSTRFSKLDAPTNGKATSNGSGVTLTWDNIATPDAVDPSYLSDHFKEYYGDHAEKYYQNRINYNSSVLGQFGYDIYIKNGGNLNLVGFTTSNSYSYIGPITGDFVIKSAYSIFKYNQSDGLTINTSNIKVDTPKPSKPSTPNTEDNENIEEDDINNEVDNDTENLD